MEGFTVSLALVDAVPVLFFGAGMLILASRFPHPLFAVGAIVSTLAGCCKVSWKLILGIWKKDISWLNRYFLPVQFTGFGLIFLSFLLGFSRIDWRAAGHGMASLPGCVLFLLAFGGMGFLGWYRKNRFNSTARTNWTAQIVNCVAQLCLLLGIVFAG